MSMRLISTIIKNLSSSKNLSRLTYNSWLAKRGYFSSKNLDHIKNIKPNKFAQVIANNQNFHLDSSPQEATNSSPHTEIYTNPEDALKDIKSNSKLLVGGFGKLKN